MVPLPAETPEAYQHITTPPLFSLFQEPSLVTKITEEIF